MKNESCKNCKFFRLTNKDEGIGDCRRFPHQLLSLGMDGVEVSWQPWVQLDDWCGEFKQSKLSIVDLLKQLLNIKRKNN